MKPRHPSGKPLRQPRRGISQAVCWPREDYVVPRLNHPRRELAGGFGFACQPEPEEPMYLETWVRQR